MKQWINFFTVSLVLLLIVKPISACKGAKNILVFVADDAGFESGTFGNKVIDTPNLDNLAKQSSVFDNSFTVVSSCSPSRSSIFTGLPPHQNGMYGLNNLPHNFQSIFDVRSFPMYLSEAGYRTGLVGKKNVAPESVYPFDFEFYDQLNYMRNITLMKDLASIFLDECVSDSRPFLLYVGFGDPHRCDFDMYGPTYQWGSFCELYGSGGKYGVIPDWNIIRYDPNDVIVPPFLPDQPEVREEIAKQYSVINRMDQGIGLIIAELERVGLLDDTMILYYSDNGIPFPGAKTNLYEGGMRVPMYVRIPNVTTGITNHAMVNQLDILPTILNYANIPYSSYPINGILTNFTGRNLLPILNQENPKGFDQVFASHNMHEVTMWYPVRVIHQQQYKLIYNIDYEVPFALSQDLYASATWQGIVNRTNEGIPTKWYLTVEEYQNRPKWQLFDVEADPLELNNLATNSNYTNILTELQALLRTWQNATSDPWIVKYIHE